jgi:hypothetical protein
MTQQSKPENVDGPPPQSVFTQMLFGSLLKQSIRVAAKLGIADFLAIRPHTVGELAAKTESHEPSLYRVLRALASVGIFAETTDRCFVLTPMASLLRSDVPNSMRDMAIMQTEEWNWPGQGEMLHSVKRPRASAAGDPQSGSDRVGRPLRPSARHRRCGEHRLQQAATRWR